MPRPRAPARDLFEFTNRRRAGGKCDLYRCKRCGREMLENTHRFAIHISICKEATAEDREVARNQLRKTKNYNLKFWRNKCSSGGARPKHQKAAGPAVKVESSSARFEESSDETLSPVSSQETLPLRNFYPPSSKYDLYDNHTTSFVDPMFDAPSSRAFTYMFELENQYRAATNGFFDSCGHPSTDAPCAPTCFDEGNVLDNHYLSSSPSLVYDSPPHQQLLSFQQQYHMLSPPSSYQHNVWDSTFPPWVESQPPRAMGGRMQHQPYMF